MSRKQQLILLLLVCLLLLCTACWDQQMLRDRKLIKAVGFDATPDGQIITTIAVYQTGGGGSDVIISSRGFTPRHTRMNLDRNIHGHFDASKNLIVMISDQLAEQDIFPLLDVFYRDPRSALIAKVAVVDGNTHNLLTMNPINHKQISEYLEELITSAEEHTIVPKKNVQLICPPMFDPGDDFAVPYLSKNQDAIEIKGVAMFDDRIMTGKLNSTESLMYLLLMDEKAHFAAITQKVNQGNQEPANYININIVDVEREVSFDVNDLEDIHVNIDLVLKASVAEFPEENLATREKVLELNNKLSNDLTEMSNTVLTKMQDANFDGLGLGRMFYAQHHDVWEQIGWTDFYPNLTIHSNVTVEIVNYGIIY